jgi:hypothetical protein
MGRSKCAESGYCALIHCRKGLTSNHKAGQRAKMAWSNGQSAIFGLKTADLNGGFRLDVVGTRRRRAVRAGAIFLADCFLLASAATDFR